MKHESPPAVRCTMLLMAFSATAFAQSVPAPASASAGASGDAVSETVILTPFQVDVSRDEGYRAGSTLSGSRLNAQLKDTAAAITVFTPEFLSDFAANSLLEMTAYAANVQVDHNDASADATPHHLSAAFGTDAKIRVRGLSASRAVDFFETIIPSDNYNSQRVELAGGPNSILFGFGSPGGLLNISTKVPNISRNHGELQLQTGSWEFRRAQADYNHALIRGKLALRLNGVWQDNEGWRRNDFGEIRRGTAAVRYEPWKTTSLKASYEAGETRTHITRPWNAMDEVSLWLGSGAPIKNANDYTAGADRPRGINRTNSVRNIHVAGPGNAGGEFLFTTANANNRRILDTSYDNLTLPSYLQSGDTLLPASMLPFEYSAWGPAAVRDYSFDRVNARLEQRLTEHGIVELAYNKEVSDARAVSPRNISITLYGDANSHLPNPDGSNSMIPNPNAGGFFFDTIWADDAGRWENEVGRLSTAWQFDLGRKLGRHNFAAMFERGALREMRFPGREILVDENNVPIADAGAPEAGGNLLTRRVYVRPGNFATYTAGDVSRPVSMQRGGRTYTSRFVNYNLNGGDTTRTTTTLLAVAQSYFWDNRIVLTAGVRSDEIKFEKLAGGRLSPIDSRVTSGGAIPNSLVFTDTIDFSATYRTNTSTVGGVLHATRNVSLFYNFSDNVGQPGLQERILPDQRPPPPPSGVTNDVGLMLTLLDGRVFLRATAFRTEQQSATGLSLNPAANRFWAASNRILEAMREASYITPAQYAERLLGEEGVLVGLADIRNEGVEASLSVNVTKNFTSLFGFSHTKVDRSNIMPEVDGWLDGERTLWNSRPGTNALLTSRGVTVQEEIVEIDRLIGQLRDFYGFSYGERPYKASASGRYSFTSGKLKGAFVGGGVRWQSRPPLGRYVDQYLANGTPVYGRTFFGPEDFKADAFVGYRMRPSWAGRNGRITLQLNVRNITDESEPMPLRYNAQRTGFSRVLLPDPRSFRLTATVEF